MAGEGGEVHVELGEVHHHVRNRLAGIKNHEGTDSASATNQFRDIGDGTGDVRLMGERDDLDRIVEHQ